MHPRNIYRKPPDFNELSLKYKEFQGITVTVSQSLYQSQNL